MADVQPYQIEGLLTHLEQMTPDSATQLTLLSACLVLLCRNRGITRSTLVANINTMFNRPVEVRHKGPCVTGTNDDGAESMGAA